MQTEPNNMKNFQANNYNLNRKEISILCNLITKNSSENYKNLKIKEN